MNSAGETAGGVNRLGAEGATAPETLRPQDRRGMILWKAVQHLVGLTDGRKGSGFPLLEISQVSATEGALTAESR